MACSSVTTRSGDHHQREAEQLLKVPDFFTIGIDYPDLSFRDSRHFSFDSQIKTRWPINDRVYGRLNRAGRNWRDRPAVILLHGWNSELAYARHFPFLAWRLNRHRVNAAMFELPFHGRRRPSGDGAIKNFISHDLQNMVEATRQAVVDARSLAVWLFGQGCPAVGLWGISLGAWLAGLAICNDPQFSFAVLLTPVPNVELAVRELDFCAPIRVALEHKDIDVSRLNLASLRPLIPRERILIIQSRYDIFAPPPVVNEVWENWERPDIWSVPHGHISVLASLPIMERTVCWISRTSVLPPGLSGLRKEKSASVDLSGMVR